MSENKQQSLFRFTEQDLRDLVCSLATSIAVNAFQSEVGEDNLDLDKAVKDAAFLVVKTYKLLRKINPESGLAPVVEAAEHALGVTYERDSAE